MYPVSEAYKNAIAQNERNVRIIGTITLKDGTVIEIDDEDIVQGSLYVSEQCVSGEDIEIGNVYASELGLSLNSPPENPYALDGARIVLNFGIETSEGVWEYVPLGYFYVTEIERKTNMVNLKALDGMILFDTDLSGVLTTGTPYEMISSCCTKAGITLATDSATFSTFANGNMTFTLPAESNVKTCRDLIMWICQLTGTFARMNRMGQLEIVPVKLGASVKTIDKQQRFTSDVSDSYVKITKVAMKVGDVEYSQGTDGMTMVLEENPLLVSKSETEINTVLSNILNQVTTAEYVPYNVNFAGDPALQAGDYVTLTGIKVFDKVSGIFTRSSIAYLSDGTQVAANTPRFEPGKFGKAIMVEEGTENKLKTVGGADVTCTSTTGWAYNSSYGTLTVVDDPTCLGGKCLVYEDTDGDTVNSRWDGFWPAADARSVGPVSPGGQITLSIRYKTENVTTGSVAVWGHWYGYNSAGNLIYDVAADWYIGSSNGVWQKKTITLTTPSSTSYPNAVSWKWGPYKPGFTKTNLGARIYVDWVQAEVKPYATSFIDGTRSPETLTIPTAGVLGGEFTVEFWVKPPQAGRIWGLIHSEGPGDLDGYIDTNGYPYFYTTNADGNRTAIWSSVPVVPNDWNYIAITIGAGVRKIHVNGQLGAQDNATPQTIETLWLGTNPEFTYFLNGLIDDLRISNRARTDEEIAAAYQSGQPLPVDEYTTLKMGFDGSLTTITTVGDSIVTHSTWRYRGPHNIKAVGKSALVRGVQAQQTKSVSAVKTVAETAREIAQAANQSTQLIQDAITGYVLIRKNETTGSNEILIMDNPDPAQARKVWRWNMGGLGYSDNVVGVDNPSRVYNVAITMDGAINADFVKAGTLQGNIIAAGSITADKLNVTSLSAISANLGTVTAGTLQGVNVIGSTIKTADAANRLEMSSGSLKTYYNSIKRVELDYDSLDFYDTDSRLTAHIYAIPEVLAGYFTLPLLEMYSYGGIRLYAQQDSNNYAEINIWKPYASQYDSGPGIVSIYATNNNPDYGGVTGYGVLEVSPGGIMCDARKIDIYTDVNIYKGYYGNGDLRVDGWVYVNGGTRRVVSSSDSYARPTIASTSKYSASGKWVTWDYPDFSAAPIVIHRDDNNLGTKVRNVTASSCEVCMAGTATGYVRAIAVGGV